MTRNTTGRDPRPDGGRRTPGVPEASEEDSDGRDPTKPEDETGASEEGTSGRRMPGVPDVGDSSDVDSRATGSSETQGRGGSSRSDDAHDNGTEPELTTAISFRALSRTRTPGAVVADANTWSDWVGVVGEVDGPELNTFFRRHSVDVDFFNDVSDGPAERLAAIDEDHHFYADRRVLVGLPEEEPWAEEAGWEFQNFEHVAEEAGWALEEE